MPDVLLREARVFGRLLARTILAAQETTAERTPWDDAEALAAACRQQLALEVAGDETVLRLQRVEPRDARLITDPQALHQLPCGEVAGAEVAHRALMDEVVERAHRFLDRCFEVPRVHLVKIDVIELEAA